MCGWLAQGSQFSLLARIQMINNYDKFYETVENVVISTE